MAATSSPINTEAFIKQAQTSLEEARAFQGTGDNSYTRESRLQESIAYSLLVIAQNMQHQNFVQ